MGFANARKTGRARDGDGKITGFDRDAAHAREITRFVYCLFRHHKSNRPFLLFRRNTTGFMIPKLVFAGSSPVARSMNFPTPPSGGVVRFLDADIVSRAKDRCLA